MVTLRHSTCYEVELGEDEIYMVVKVARARWEVWQRSGYQIGEVFFERGGWCTHTIRPTTDLAAVVRILADRWMR